MQLDARRTLQDVSFCIERGEWAVLLGANGSGKSTLARLANGLLLPNEGEVIADDVSSWHHNELGELRKKVGLVTQDPDNQIVSTTVFDEVAFGPQNLGWEPKRIYTSVTDALEQVGLSEEQFAKRDPNSLSGGEKQRVVIAAILAMEPNYLVLDEPTAMLDPRARTQVMHAIALAAKSGRGVLQITHHLEEARQADRVLVLSEGRLVYEGAPEGILDDDEALTAYGLKAKPQVRGLLSPSADEGAEAEQSKVSKQDERSERNELSEQDAQPEQEIPSKRDMLSLERVTFSYADGSKRAAVFEDLSLSLGEGECVLLVGASGSGKSTLLSLAAGLLTPDTGTVLLNEAAPHPGEVGLVFQQPETQLFAQSLKEDVLFGPRNLGKLTPSAEDDIVDRSLAAVGLNPERFKNRSPYSLSGGEARRAAIATILALDTGFLLLDEPTAGLDARGRVFIYELIQGLLAKGTGVVIATHDPDFFSDLAARRMEL